MVARCALLVVFATIACLAGGCSTSSGPKHCSGGSGVYDLETCKYLGPSSGVGGTNLLGDGSAGQEDASADSAAASDASNGDDASDAGGD